MINIGSKCFSQQCTQVPKYYCCDPQYPACTSCSKQTCELCHKKRNNTLKSLMKNINVVSDNHCYKCKCSIQGQSLSFKCNHVLCFECMCQQIIQLIETGVWINNIVSESMAIKCKCSEKSVSNVSMLLNKYCFCCGKKLDQKQSFKLKNGLMLRIDCKNRIKYQDDLFQDQERSLQKRKQIVSRMLKKDLTLTASATIQCQKKIQRAQKQEKQIINEDKSDKVSSKQGIFKKKDKLYLQEQAIREEAKSQAKSKSKYYSCIICGKKQLIENSREKIQQNESYCCHKCQKQQEKIINESVKSNQLKNSHSQRSQISNQYTKYLKKQKEYLQFRKYISIGHNSVKNLIRKERFVQPSIFQEQPDPVEIEIQDLEISSCFKCGYFLKKSEVLVRNDSIYCLKCYLQIIYTQR